MMNKKEWATLTYRNPKAFGIENGFTDLTELHNEWLRSFLFEKEDFTLQAHRGSYKTSCLAVAIALILIIYPELAVIFLRRGDTDVKEVIRLVSKLLQSEIYNALARATTGRHLTIATENAFEIDTNLKLNPSGAPQLLGIGSRSSLTGKHADIVITDDIVNLEDRISAAARDRTKLAYQELQNVKNRGGRFINTGTPWHKDDAFALMPNLHTYDCYSTGLISEEELKRLRNSMTPALFAANYELRHIADENLLFTSPQLNGEPLHIYDGICHIDAAYGGDDSSAFTILKENEGKLYVFGDLRQKHITECLPMFEAYRKEYRAGTLYCEKNADKGFLAKEIQDPVQTYNERMNKHIKIATYLKANWDKVIFIKGTSQEYINQILDYTENAAHDDAPDSLASLIRILEERPQVRLFRGGII